MSPDDVGAQLVGGKYEMLRELGAGGSATVYLARDVTMERLVAVKVLREEVAFAFAEERFSREIRLMARLEHPHIVPILDSGRWGARLYYVMPYIEGESLESRLGRMGRLPVDDVLRLAHELCDALSHAHMQRVIHRDVKPSNVLLDVGGHARLSDFGVARLLDLSGDDRLTASDTSVGTIAYMSPEQAARERRLDARTDIFSLGCVLYEALAGELPFHGATPVQTLAMRLTASAPPLRSKLPEASASLERAIARALATTPELRCGSAREFANELGVPLGAAAAGVGLPPSAVGRRHRRSARVYRLLIAAAFIVLTASTWRWFESHRGVGPGFVFGPRLMAAEQPVGVSASAFAAYESARQSIAKWDLSDAERHLLRAVRSDTAFALAALWLAQVRAWLTADSTSDASILALVTLASRNPDRLSKASLRHASGLRALLERDYPGACGHYKALVASDSTSFVGWFGLGECNRLDSVVVLEHGALAPPRFRGDWNEAFAAYSAAIGVAPHAGTLSLLRRGMDVTIIRSEKRRTGRLLRDPSQVYAAAPSLTADSISWMPQSVSDVASGAPSTATPELSPGYDRQRAMRLRFVRALLPFDPSNVQLLVTLASLHEVQGDLVDGRHGTESAAALLRRALAVAQSADERSMILVHLSRVGLKAGDYGAVPGVLDSLDRLDPAAVSDTTARWIAALAALAGDDSAFTRWFPRYLTSTRVQREVFGTPVSSRLRTTYVALRLAVDLGRCAHIQTSRDQMERDIATEFDAVRRHNVWQQAIQPVLVRAITCADESGAFELPAGTYPAGAMIRAAAQGDSARARRYFGSVIEIRKGFRPADITWDAVLLEAWGLLAIGDTASAIKHIDDAMAAFPLSGETVIREPALAGAFTRAMTLRRRISSTPLRDGEVCGLNALLRRSHEQRPKC